MDYEKKYKEALGWMRKLYPSFEGHMKEDVEHYFPELKESEDERIRKKLIQLISCMHDADHRKKDWLTWLEKQDKETSWKPSKEEMDVLYGLAYITNQYDEHKEEVITRLYQDLKREFFNGSSYENMFTTNSEKIEINEKSRWTDEDEEIMRDCCNAIAAADYYTMEGKEVMENWLVSLKQRMQVPFDYMFILGYFYGKSNK